MADDTEYLLFFVGHKPLDPRQELGHIFGTVFLSEKALRDKGKQLFPKRPRNISLRELARLLEVKGYKLARVVKPAVEPTVSVITAETAVLPASERLLQAVAT